MVFNISIDLGWNLRPPWLHVGFILRLLGRLGGVLERLGRVLGSSRAVSGRLGRVLERKTVPI